MDNLRELYQQVILDHNRNPKNFGPLESANREAEGYNPLCGDHYTIYLEIEDDIVKNAAFDGSGCAISKSSASVMTQILKGKSLNEATELFGKFIRMVKGELDDTSDLGKLAVFEGVREFPTRTKCATLSWHAMKNALEGAQETAKTE
ncbi:MAG: SUF system NifU family Fe-S cluster assembly protein [Thermoanaerobaculia bacterium]|nr:SUF system NifU family Fe-S cluster assembly protein [Thermoanaerobaculia bacterium]